MRSRLSLRQINRAPDDRGESGMSTLEMALVLPLLLMLLLGALDFGRAVVLYNMASLAARDGARAAQVMIGQGDTGFGTGEPAQIRTAALHAAGPLTTMGSNVTVAATAAKDADATSYNYGYFYVKVVVSVTYQPIVGSFLHVGSRTLTATSRINVPCGKC